MATRPQARGGLTGIHYWFMVFVGLWLVSTVLLVILYTDQNTLKLAAQDWQEERARFILPQEQNTLSTWMDRARTTNRSLVGILNDERVAALKMIAGEQGDSQQPELAAAEKLAGDAVRRIATEQRVADPSLYTLNTDLKTIIERLYDEHVGLADTLASAKTENEELKQRELARLEERAEEQRSFADAAAGLSQRVETIQADFSASVQEREGQINDLTGQITQLREEAEQKRKDAEQQIATLDDQVMKLATILVDVREKEAKLFEQDPSALIRDMDGKILEAVPAAGIAYVSVGRRDRVVQGLTFEVYPPSGRINADGSGKGTVEVISVGPDTAECRITRYDVADPIVPGDLINNIVYDRRQTTRFVAIGGFDLNGDGVADEGGEDVISALITDWGGTVAAEVDATTNFVVIGAQPTEPGLPEDASPEDEVRAADQKELFDRYQRIRTEATRLAVPLLTQTQFLNLMGFLGSSGAP